jgi:beta-galactosidase
MFHKDTMLGKLVVLVKSTITAGDIKLEVKVLGLRAVKLTGSCQINKNLKENSC